MFYKQSENIPTTDTWGAPPMAPDNRSGKNGWSGIMSPNDAAGCLKRCCGRGQGDRWSRWIWGR